MPQKGRISVATALCGEWAEVRVEDTGSGIPFEIQEHIFDPFFTTKDVGLGTGKGLSMAHNVVVTKHGGRLDFETLAGEGTTFVAALPLSKPSDRIVST